VPVDTLTVLHHAMVADFRAQHGVPGPVLQQQIIPLDVDHSWHMFVPERCTVPGQHGLKRKINIARSAIIDLYYFVLLSGGLTECTPEQTA